MQLGGSDESYREHALKAGSSGALTKERAYRAPVVYTVSYFMEQLGASLRIIC